MADAEQALRQAIGLDPGGADLHATLSHLLARLRRWDEAIASAKEAIARDSQRSHLHTHLGALLRERIRDDQIEAERVLRRAIELDRTNANAYAQLGHLLSSVGRLEAAIEVTHKATALEPRNPHHQGLLGRLLLDDGDPTAAEASLRTVVELAPDNAHGYSNFSEALMRQGRFREAVAAMATAVDLQPANVGFRQRLADMQREVGAAEKHVA